MKDRKFVVAIQWGIGDDGKSYDSCVIYPLTDDFDEAYDGWNFVGHRGQEGASIDVYSNLIEAIRNSNCNPFKIKYDGLTNEEIQFKDDYLKLVTWSYEEG